MTHGTFRCPFEIKGEKEGKILHIHLTDDRDMGFQLMKAAFECFHADRSVASIKFHFPASLLEKTRSIHELSVYMIPYQADILAAELDYRLSPVLAYHMQGLSSDEQRDLYDQHRYRYVAARLLERVITSLSMPVASVKDLSNWIGIMMITSLRSGNAKTSIGIHDDKNTTHLTISDGSVHLHHEDYVELVGEAGTYRNCFGIITCPFYPTAFGRYTEDVTLVMSRMKDFTDLKQADRRKIRRATNTILRDHGVKIMSLEDDKQPDGLWIPEYVDGRSE